MVEIKANGDIVCDDQLKLACNQGTVMEFNFKKKNKKWKEAQNSHFLPETFHISPTTATEFWVKEKSVVQNALLCCQPRSNHVISITRPSLESPYWLFQKGSILDECGYGQDRGIRIGTQKNDHNRPFSWGCHFINFSYPSCFDVTR